METYVKIRCAYCGHTNMIPVDNRQHQCSMCNALLSLIEQPDGNRIPNSRGYGDHKYNTTETTKYVYVRKTKRSLFQPTEDA